MESLRVALGSRSYPIHIGEGILDERALYLPYVTAGSPRPFLFLQCGS